MLFSRTVGVKHWLCPSCGHFNRTKVNAIGGHRVKCRDANCQQVFICGEVFYRTLPGHKVPPPDRILPLEVSQELWRSGQPVNRLVRESES